VTKFEDIGHINKVKPRRARLVVGLVTYRSTVAVLIEAT